jgi:elongation factor 2
MKGAPIKVTEPVVSFCETVTTESSQMCVSKSANKHNRITATAQPLSEELVKDISDGVIAPGMEVKKMRRALVDNHNFGMDEAKRLWTFGCPPDALANMLIDSTKGVQYMNEIKDSCVGAFIQVSMAGVFCEEMMSGVRVDIEDVTMHADAIHRGAGQIMPPMKRVVYACQMKSGPGLLEPMYVADITVPQNAVSGVYQTLNARRGMVQTTEERPGTPLCKVKAFLPVLESFGFTNVLRANTSGQAFPQMIFSHWQLLNGDVMDEGSSANEICLAVRKRKGLKDGLPKFADYYDKV